MIYQLSPMPLYKALHLEEFKSARDSKQLIQICRDMRGRAPAADLILAAWRHSVLLDMSACAQQDLIDQLDSIYN